MGDWQELGQTVCIGLIFSFLVAKLISTVISFRDENLRVVRQDELPDETPDYESKNVSITNPTDPTTSDTGISRDGEEGEEIVEGVSEGIMGGDDEDDEDDDWEGIESTELDEAFSAASVFVAAAAADRLSAKVSNDVQLQLYGLYKIATEGPCTAPQPSALKMTARAKWNAWQKLGAMPTEEAMQQYVMLVSELYPSWATGSTNRSQVEGSSTSNSAAKGTMGPVFSSFVHQEESDNELKLDAIHACAREGDANDLLKYLDDGISVNLRDSDGRTPLHWAVDRGHLKVVELLISRKADVNAKDYEGQTPLHYAVLCEREAIAEFLIKHGADQGAKDNDDSFPRDLGGSAWAFMSCDN